MLKNHNADVQTIDNEQWRKFEGINSGEREQIAFQLKALI
jgi:hypothetical protein